MSGRGRMKKTMCYEKVTMILENKIKINMRENVMKRNTTCKR